MAVFVVFLLWVLQFCLVSSLVGAFAPLVSVQPRPKTVRWAADEEAKEGAADTPEARVKPITESPMEAGTHEELMYALGVNLARQLGDVRPLVENGDELASIAKGLLDTVIGRLTPEGQEGLLARRGQDLNAIVQQRALAIQQRLEAAGRDMLKQMEETEGAERLESGVILHVLESNSDGPRPTMASTVRVHYHGTLPDGKVFDSTLSRDPAVFTLGQLIPGWREAVLKMHEGETAMIGIPPEQAYGKAGTPDGRIPGGSTLFFKVQLLEVLTAAVGGAPTLLGADGKKLGKEEGGGGLVGADGKPL